MAKVAEGIARVASGIASGRQQRSKLAMEIKNATRSRRSEVRSLLESLKASRVRTTNEQAAEAKKIVRARHGEVHSSMQGLKASRTRAAREYKREAIVIINGRRSEMKALLSQFRRVRIARRQHFQELAAAQRIKAAVFMRDLTSGVAALLDKFDKEGSDRAKAIRERLAAYASDRQEAVDIWLGKRHREQRTGAHSAEASHRSAHESPPIQSESPAPHGSSASPHDVAAAQAQEAAARSAKHPFGALGRKGSSEHSGKDSK
jgi:hypothetical protein